MNKKNIAFGALFLVAILGISFVSWGLINDGFPLRDKEKVGTLEVLPLLIKDVNTLGVDKEVVEGKKDSTVTNTIIDNVNSKPNGVVSTSVSGTNVINNSGSNSNTTTGSLNVNNIGNKPVGTVVVGSQGTHTIPSTNETSSCSVHLTLSESQEGSFNGYSVSIYVMTSDHIVLKVEGELTNVLSEGDTFTLDNGRTVTIKDISKTNEHGSTSFVELCA